MAEGEGLLQGLQEYLSEAQKSLSHAQRWTDWCAAVCEYYEIWIKTGIPPEKFPEWEG
jgi:hypothetical protein